MHPIQGGSEPYHRSAQLPRRDLAVAGSTTLRLVPRADAPETAADVELSVRLFADGGSITVKRRTVAEADGSRRTVGIDAVIR